MGSAHGHPRQLFAHKYEGDLQDSLLVCRASVIDIITIYGGPIYLRRSVHRIPVVRSPSSMLFVINDAFTVQPAQSIAKSWFTVGHDRFIQMDSKVRRLRTWTPHCGAIGRLRDA